MPLISKARRGPSTTLHAIANDGATLRQPMRKASPEVVTTVTNTGLIRERAEGKRAAKTKRPRDPEIVGGVGERSVCARNYGATVMFFDVKSTVLVPLM